MSRTFKKERRNPQNRSRWINRQSRSYVGEHYLDDDTDEDVSKDPTFHSLNVERLR